MWSRGRSTHILHVIDASGGSCFAQHIAHFLLSRVRSRSHLRRDEGRRMGALVGRLSDRAGFAMRALVFVSVEGLFLGTPEPLVSPVSISINEVRRDQFKLTRWITLDPFLSSSSFFFRAPSPSQAPFRRLLLPFSPTGFGARGRALFICLDRTASWVLPLRDSAPLSPRRHCAPCSADGAGRWRTCHAVDGELGSELSFLFVQALSISLLIYRRAPGARMGAPEVWEYFDGDGGMSLTHQWGMHSRSQ